METRKIYVSGGSTYVISLPKKWVKNANLDAGSSVVVTPQGSSLIVEPGIVRKSPAEADIKTSQVTSAEALERLVISYYLVGYDTIKIKFNHRGRLNYRERIRETLNLLIGAEILEDAGDRMIIEILLDHERMPTTQALRRIYLIGKGMLNDIIKALKNGDVELARDVIVREREVDRLYFLVVHQLKSAVRYQQVAEKLGITQQRDCLGYRIIVKSFERIADHTENIALSYVQLAEIEKKADLSDYVQLAGDVMKIYEKAAMAMFKRDMIAADGVFYDFEQIKKYQSAISNQLFKKRSALRSAMLKKAMLDSMGRIAGYSSDIAEITINMSIKVP